MAFSDWTTPARPGSGSHGGRFGTFGTGRAIGRSAGYADHGRSGAASGGPGRGAGARGGRSRGQVDGGFLSSAAKKGRGAADAAGKAGAVRKSPRSVTPAATLVLVDDLEVWVVRKRVKNLNLRVTSPHARIQVSAPEGLPDQVIADFVREKRSWIAQHQQRVLNSPMAQAGAASKEQVQEWRNVVKAFAPQLIAKWEPVLGVKAQALAYRNMTSRWGSCQPATGRICLNVRLALYPPECLEYVVVHELCHLRVRGHGPQFWALVEQCLPNYRAARAKLGE